MDNKLEVLKQVAEELNKANVDWALGASAMLYFNGIVSEFNDFDVIIAQDDYPIAKKILFALAQKEVTNDSSMYQSAFFHKLIIDDVQFDVIVDYTIVIEKTKYCFPLEDSNRGKDFYLQDCKIPTQSIAHWAMLYSLMGRSQRVEQINNYLKKDLH